MPDSRLEIDREVFNGPPEPDHGFTVKAYFLKAPNAADALVEIWRENQPYRRFLFPAYKVWNIAAHFSDIVAGELAAIAALKGAAK